jgi:hypothetical protein
MGQELKDQLKPPFYHECGYIRDATSIPVAEVGLDYKIICDFIAAALNEKWERDFSEPLRWIKTRSLGGVFLDCPKCKHGLQEGTKELNYCPFCGQKLLPPENNVS